MTPEALGLLTNVKLPLCLSTEKSYSDSYYKNKQKQITVEQNLLVLCPHIRLGLGYWVFVV
jgi:hypothetical protein